MRKKLLAVVLAVFVFGLIAASAATLGGINTADLGADTAVVASCDTVGGVDVDYNFTYNSGAPGYFEVVSVDVSSIDAACDNFAIEVTLGDGTDPVLGSGSVVDLGTTGTINVPISAGVDAELVTEIGIVISG